MTVDVRYEVKILSFNLPGFVFPMASIYRYEMDSVKINKKGIFTWFSLSQLPGVKSFISQSLRKSIFKERFLCNSEKRKYFCSPIIILRSICLNY
jgi:hypothetical protein